MTPQPVEYVDWFAQREEESYRDEARNILDSYAHPWDILAELAQNAVDAIETRRADIQQAPKGRIEIEIDQPARLITGSNGGRLIVRPSGSGRLDRMSTCHRPKG